MEASFDIAVAAAVDVVDYMALDLRCYYFDSKVVAVVVLEAYRLVADDAAAEQRMVGGHHAYVVMLEA